MYGINNNNNNNNKFVIYSKAADNDEVHSLYMYDIFTYLIGHDQVVAVVVIVPDDGQLNKLKHVEI